MMRISSILLALLLLTGASAAPPMAAAAKQLQQPFVANAGQRLVVFEIFTVPST